MQSTQVQISTFSIGISDKTHDQPPYVNDGMIIIYNAGKYTYKVGISGFADCSVISTEYTIVKVKKKLINDLFVMNGYYPVYYTQYVCSKQKGKRNRYLNGGVILVQGKLIGYHH